MAKVVKKAAAAKTKSAKQVSKQVKKPGVNPSLVSNNERTKAFAFALPKVDAKGNALEMLKVSTETVKEIFENSANEAQKVQERLFFTGREGAEQLAKTADVATRSFSEVFSVARDSAAAYAESGNYVANWTKTVSAELFNYANKSFSQNVEISKELMTCRTFNDMFEVQSKLVQSNLTQWFDESLKLSDMWFKTADEAAEPISERVSEATERLSKAFAA